MDKIWAVARQMIAEGIRMKIALVFLVLIGLVVLGLPFSITGDASVTGAVQSFMSYGFTATAILLSILTIFLSRSLSDDLVHRQIFLVLTKPLPRWQYVVGKWLGITLLNFVFLMTAGAAIYGMVHYIKATHPPLDPYFDAQELANEVLVARHAVKYEPPDFRRTAELEFDRNLEEGIYDDRPDFSKQEELDRLERKYEAKWRVVGPGDARMFTFKNVLVDRSEGHFVQLRYKTNVTYHAPDMIFRARWVFGDRNKGTPERVADVRHRVDRWQTVRVQSDVVAPDNTLTVRLYNINPYEGLPQYKDEHQIDNVFEFHKSDDVTLLFVVGSFEGNMLRLLALIMCKLMFLAAVATLMTTVFSFPVACLASFTVYVMAAGQSFIIEGLDQLSVDGAGAFTSVAEFLLHTVFYLLLLVKHVLPDFARFDAVETLVNGHNVSLVWVLQAVTEVAMLKSAIALGLAVLLFHRREVAEVSV